MNKVSEKIKKYKAASYETDDRAIETYLSHPDHHKNPLTGTKYVGIEIECFSKMGRVAIQKLFFKYDLEDFVMVGDDPTIEPPETNDPDKEVYWHTFELRLLIPQQHLKPTLKRFGKVFRLARLKANESCGLHVHLDMRQREPDECYQKLLRFQDALFAIVNKDRWLNDMCLYTKQQDREHHMAINYTMAYSEHQTIEVRVHHGCVDTDRITNWIQLLINIVDARSVPEPKSKKDVLKWKGLNKKLRGYVTRNFKQEWFDNIEEADGLRRRELGVTT